MNTAPEVSGQFSRDSDIARCNACDNEIYLKLVVEVQCETTAFKTIIFVTNL